MNAETTNQMPDQKAPLSEPRFVDEPVEMVRTPEEKARILARRTIALASIDKKEDRANGNA